MLLSAVLLLAQVGAATHVVTHATDTTLAADGHGDGNTSGTRSCEQCLAFAKVGHAASSTFTPDIANRASTPLAIVASAATPAGVALPPRSRGPPDFT